MAVEEIVSNIIKYAWPEGGAHELVVHLTRRDDLVEIEVVDDGQPFDPSATAPAAHDRGPRKPGGLGLRLLGKLVDRISYARSAGKNHVWLSKRCGSAKPAAPGGVADEQK